jgi:hypothetical protein
VTHVPKCANTWQEAPFDLLARPLLAEVGVRRGRPPRCVLLEGGGVDPLGALLAPKGEGPEPMHASGGEAGEEGTAAALGFPTDGAWAWCRACVVPL